MDGIVYGVTVSLGFATYENYDYVFRLAELWEIDPYQMAIWRSYTAVPLHGLNGCVRIVCIVGMVGTRWGCG